MWFVMLVPIVSFSFSHSSSSFVRLCVGGLGDREIVRLSFELDVEAEIGRRGGFERFNRERQRDYQTPNLTTPPPPRAHPLRPSLLQPHQRHRLPGTPAHNPTALPHRPRKNAHLLRHLGQGPLHRGHQLHLRGSGALSGAAR